MAVTVKIPTLLRAQVDGRPTIEGTGRTLGDVIDDIETRYPGIKGSLVTDDGGLHRFVNVYLNDEDVRVLAGLETPVSEADILVILPAMAGGSPS